MTSRRKKANSQPKPPRNRKKGPPDIRPSKASKNGCELGDLPLEIAYHIMEHLFWANSVPLGLTCPQMYGVYKRLYPLKIKLRHALDGPARYNYSPTQIPLYRLINGWHGLGQGYELWTEGFSWEHPLRRKRAVITALAPARFVLESVYPRVPKDASDDHPGKILRRRLRESYEDYYFFTRPHHYQKYTCKPLQEWSCWPIPWEGGDNAELPFESSHLPNPFNVGLQNWEEQAKGDLELYGASL
ncbi:predicted protein [Sclerotinia sclerotiorum 1980 UF-70]|uniref:F-box domain-containing protein n=2 Tax=Sclerotinia sclerotiorum (strain ATCC 18683 / 1980 / Ss-1) TaxID=665079 RepID=A7EVI2_SCLS1|nr:predicted protein [Sclerotinia sclerotiorum 1980 UF-70]APA15804.1 hypothetical protein sscle_15g105740 [Sclerotinia sclerotiorum 1980 UF-70]EDN93474.1 predicted protein [Sclerotinia sclerotiorum 1980 UF-70]